MGATNSTQSSITLKTPKGSLRGIQLSDARSGKPVYHRYTRIPYALPPVGPRRWHKPHPLPEDYSFNADGDQPGDYTSFGPICPQPAYNHNSVRLDNLDAAPEPENVQDEDCLYLNVWVPVGGDGEKPEGGWPVQFYIHGGWLQVGDAMQNNSNEPFDLLLSTPYPRIIVSPTYRLNLFGFLCSPTDLTPSSPSACPSLCPGNFGFWDQRLALEWTHQNISHFSGNPQNITIGGLSAGAYSAMFQLYHDTYFTPPSGERLIRRAFFWSNAVGVQPNLPTSPAIRSQFDELAFHLNIDPSLPVSEKLSILRTIPASSFVAVIPKLKSHTFRAVTDNALIPPNFLHSIYHPETSDFSQRLKRNGMQILLGEVAHEARLYRLVNPPSNRAELELQLRNYYPGRVVDAQMKHYELPSASSSFPSFSSQQKKKRDEDEAESWKDIYAHIVSTAQIHAPIRGLTRALLSHPSGLTISDLFRYRISWRASSLDPYLDPSAGVCHGADAPIWWMSGLRAGFTSEDKRKVDAFLEPFGRFVYGGQRGEVGWGTKAEGEVRLMGGDGLTTVVRDEGWEEGLRGWRVMWAAQL